LPEGLKKEDWNEILLKKLLLSVLELAMMHIVSLGEPTIDDMLTVAEKVGLNKQRSKQIIEEVNTLVKENKIK